MRSIIITLLIFFASQSFAQMDSVSVKEDMDLLPPRDLFVWFSAGAGVVGPMAGIRVSASYAKGVDCFTAIYSYGESLATDGGDEYLREFSFCYGRQNFTNRTIGRISLGLGYFNGKRNYELYKTVGAVIGVEGILKFSPVGIGLDLGLRAGPKLFSPRFTVNLYFGKLD
jgi:hypothetical protein